MDNALDHQVFLSPLAVAFYCLAAIMVVCGCGTLVPSVPRLTYVLAALAASGVVGLAVAVAHQPVEGVFAYHLADAEHTMGYAAFGGAAVLLASILALLSEAGKR